MKSYFTKSFLAVSVSLALIGTAQATSPGFVKPSSDAPPRSADYWWPDQVDLSRLRQNSYNADPYGEQFEYAKAFASLDLDTVKSDINDLLTDSQDWWPADYGNYLGLFVRLAWHSAGTYRMGDGRGGSAGGQQRFEPLNSWPDNGNLDKARRLLWPVKKKYGHNLSWSDLIILAGNVSLENAGLETYGFAGGRIDAWEPELVYWGPETKFLTSERFTEDRELESPLAASELGLIYVNPEGPGGNPDILAAAKDIRTTFGRMGMNDEETAALIVGGHTVGKSHGAHNPEECVGVEPAAESVDAQGLGWKNKCGTGNAGDTTTSGLEGAWTATPVTWSNSYVENLYNYEWEQTKSPAGAVQWTPVSAEENAEEVKVVPDAHDPNIKHAPFMLTTDLALRYDEEYGKVTKRFSEDPQYMYETFAKAWFKLTHRDMGPSARYVGAEVPSEDLIWQDPLPQSESKALSSDDVQSLKDMIRNTDLSNSALVRAAWGSAATFRDTDLRGGANGARISLAPQKDWVVNDPEELNKVIAALETIQEDFTNVSLADLIVLGGVVALENAAESAGHSVEVPFTAGRVDASQDQTDIDSVENLRPAADGFRNYMSDQARLSPSEMLIDRADMLTLTVPEMAVLVAGMRVLDANSGAVKHGVLTDQPGSLSNDFFVNLLDMSTTWSPAENEAGVFEGRNADTGDVKWTATEVDLIFGSNAELRAVAEAYAYDGSEEKFVTDFVDAWTKVMMLDRFDLSI